MMSQFSRRLKLSAVLSVIMAASMASQAAAENGSRPGGPGGPTGPTGPTAPAGDVIISATVNSGALNIGANPTLAGAVDSLIFRGVQYVFNYENGASFQADSAYNNEGQCFNPTEAGSQNNNGTSSSSDLLSISNSSNAITSSTNMAFWLAPGQTNTNGQECDPPYDTSTVAANTTVISNHILNKTISIGANGIANLMTFNNSFYVPNAFNSGDFIFNAYMTSTFPNFLIYNPNTKTLAAAIPGQQYFTSLIVSTVDGTSALGAISIPANGSPALQASNEKVNINGQATSTNILQCSIGVAPVQAGGTYDVNCPLAIGTVDEIILAINSYVGTSDVSIPVYRFRNAPDMVWTTSYTSGATLWGSSTFNGVAFRVNPQGVSNSNLTLYSCVRSGTSDYFISDSSTCEGRTVLGVLGYASSGPSTGLTELYRFYNSSLGIHLVTVSYTEGTSAGGFSYEGPLGYVPTS